MSSPARRYPEWCLVTVNCTNTNTKSDNPRLHSLVPMGNFVAPQGLHQTPAFWINEYL